MEIDDLKMIKKYYGEDMMHFCRENFSTILEQNGKLFEILSKHFEFCKTLFQDIVNDDMLEEFKIFIYSFFSIEQETVVSSKTPAELLDEAGYILYECHTEEDIQSFRHYYSTLQQPFKGISEYGVPLHIGEELCTFSGGRLYRDHVFFAVKKNVDEIKRENFPNPEREDEYGTSVISIQFSRGNVNILSIKNRYNHTVKHCDATFGNNLDKIITGLSYAFHKEYGFNIISSKDSFYLYDYILTHDGKFIKYNYEINGIYYCRDNVIVDNGQIKRYDKDKYIVMDYFILDKVNKKIFTYDKIINDSFISSIGKIESIEEHVDKDKKGRKIIINKSIEISIDKDNRIINYVNKNIEEIGNDFLYYNMFIENIDIPNVIKIGNNFLRNNNSLRNFSDLNLKVIGDCFLMSNRSLEKLSISNVITIGNGFLMRENHLKEIDFPNLRTVGAYFMEDNGKIGPKLELPNLVDVGDFFLPSNKNLIEFIAPKLKRVGDSFICANDLIEFIDMPELEYVDDHFLSSNNSLTSISFPNLKTIKNSFLYANKIMKKIDLPSVKEIGSNFLYNVREMRTISLPNVDYIDKNFLYSCYSIIEINLPNVNIIKDNFLHYCSDVEKVIMPNVGAIGSGFLSLATYIKELYIPNVIIIDDAEFLSSAPEEMRNEYKDKFMSTELLPIDKRKRK